MKNELYLDELYEHYVQTGNADNGDYAAAINWGMDFWKNQRRKQVLSVKLHPRKYICKSSIQVVNGRSLRIRGTGGYTVTGSQVVTSVYPGFDNFSHSTLQFTTDVTGSTGYIYVRNGINPYVINGAGGNWTGGFEPPSEIDLEGFAIYGPSGSLTMTDPIDGIRIRGPARLHNLSIRQIPRHGIDARASIMMPDPTDEMYGGANNLFVSYVSINTVGACGWITDGADSNGSCAYQLDVNDWGKNPNFASGSAAAGTSNVAAILDSSFIMATYIACHTGGNSNGHWRYVAVDPGTITSFFGCYQEGLGDSCVLFSNMTVGGIIDHTPGVVIQPETGFNPAAIGLKAFVRMINGNEIQGDYRLNVPNNQHRDYVSLGNTNTDIPSATPSEIVKNTFMILGGGGTKNYDAGGGWTTDPSAWRLHSVQHETRPSWLIDMSNLDNSRYIAIPQRRYNTADALDPDNLTDTQYLAPWQFGRGIRLGSGGWIRTNYCGETGDPAVVSGATRGGIAVFLLTTDAALKADPNHRKQAMGWASAPPTSGTWSAGDVLFDSTGATNGWRCTVGGTPGTWVVR